MGEYVDLKGIVQFRVRNAGNNPNAPTQFNVVDGSTLCFHGTGVLVCIFDSQGEVLKSVIKNAKCSLIEEGNDVVVKFHCLKVKKQYFSLMCLVLTYVLMLF